MRWALGSGGAQSGATHWRPQIVYFGGGGGGNTTTTQTSEPWFGQQGPLQDIYTQATGLDTSAVPQYYPSSTYAPLTSQQTGLANQIGSYGAGGGNSSINAANNNLTSIINGGNASTGTFGQANDTLSSEMDPANLNPWNTPGFANTVNQTLATVVPQTSASFINGGRADSGLAQRATTEGATDAVGQLVQNQYQSNLAMRNSAADTASQNYLTGQGQQIQAAGVAPIVDQTQLGDMSTGLNAAGVGQTNNQDLINAAIQQWNYQQMQPWNQLGMYESAITGTGSPGGQTTTTQPYYSNTGANVLAGVGTAATLAASVASIAAAI